MSYLSQAQDPRSRAGALAATLAINGAIGVLIVTGLTMTGFRTPDDHTPIIDFNTPKPPEPEPTPPEPVEYSAPTPTAPVPPIPIPQPPGPARDVFDPTADLVPNLPVIPDPGPTVRPTLTPTPTPSFTPRLARPSNDSSRWITTDDYPRRSLLDQSEGTARYRVVVGTNGRVSSCEVTSSTGDTALDEATCRFITRRARFEAATDDNGAKVVGTYTGTVRWEIPN